MIRLGRALKDVGTVIPRSVVALRSDGAWHPLSGRGMRQLAEVAVDELALTAMTLTGPMGIARRPYELYEQVSTGLCALDLDVLHAEPAPLRPTDCTRKRIGSIVYEQMTFDHDPKLPRSLAALGLGGAASAVFRVLRHADGPRPCLLWVHGTGMGGASDLLISRANHYFHGLGYDVVLPVQPGQGIRRHDRPRYPDVDPIVNVAGMLRCISEVRAVARWVRPNAASVTIAGLSLGTAVAAFVSHLETDVDAVALYAPILGLNEMLVLHQSRWGADGDEVRRLMTSPAVTAMTALIDPVPFEPAAPTAHRLVVGAWHDRMATRAPVEALHHAWRGDLHWHDGGHLGVLCSSEVRRVTERFLARVAA